MAGSKIKIKYQYVICVLMSILICPAFADNTISKIDYPAEFSNSFFAPTENIAETQTKLLSKTETNTVNPFIELNKLPAPSQHKTEIRLRANKIRPATTLKTDPFSVLNNITLPSQYKKPEKQMRTTVEAIQTLPANDTMQSTVPAKSSDYVSSVVEEVVPHDISPEGRTITKIKISGLNTINENVIFNAIKTENGRSFNTDLLQDDLANIYDLGYFSDDIYIEPTINDDGSVTVTFILEENLKVENVDIKGNSCISKAELIPLVKNLEQLPQNLNSINESIEKINNYYHEKGYILSNVVNVEDNADGNLIFVVSEGIIGKINLEGNEKTKDYVIKRNILTKEGSVYNEEIFKKDISKIYSTQIFEKVDRTIEPSPEKEGEYIVTVKVKEDSSNNVSIGLGLDNALGGFGSVRYNEKNLFGRNQKLSLSGMLGSGLLLSDASIKNRMNWNIELNFFEPHLYSENNSFASKLYYRDLGSYQIPLAVERRWGISNTIAHKVAGYDNLTTSLAFGYENISLKEGDLEKISEIYRNSGVDFAKRSEQLKGGSFLNFAPEIKYSTLDNQLMPREGLEAKISLMEAIGLTETKRSNGRLVGAINRYIPIFKKSTLLIGAKGGVKVHGNDMPEVMAFRLGGPYTVRGFRMNGVGSGEGFVMATSEIQTPIPFLDRCKYDIIKNLRFAFFVDAGHIFDPTITSTLYDRPLSAITMGAGLRINIPGMNTITIDYGLPITNTGKYGSKHGYFTFGTGGLYDSY